MFGLLCHRQPTLVWKFFMPNSAYRCGLVFQCKKALFARIAKLLCNVGDISAISFVALSWG